MTILTSDVEIRSVYLNLNTLNFLEYFNFKNLYEL